MQKSHLLHLSPLQLNAFNLGYTAFAYMFKALSFFALWRRLQAAIGEMHLGARAGGEPGLELRRGRLSPGTQMCAARDPLPPATLQAHPDLRTDRRFGSPLVKVYLYISAASRTGNVIPSLFCGQQIVPSLRWLNFTLREIASNKDSDGWHFRNGQRKGHDSPSEFATLDYLIFWSVVRLLTYIFLQTICCGFYFIK